MSNMKVYQSNDL